MTSSGNDLLRDLVAQMEARYLDDHSHLSMSDWVIENTTLKGRPFSFKGYEFQKQIVDDLHPDLVVIKCSQVGLTETQIRKILGYLKRTTAIKALISFPTEEMFKRVSQVRIKPIVDGDRCFNLEDDDKSIRSMALIQIGKSYLYVTGCTEKDATSLDLDALFHDELDLSDPKMIGLFQSRLQNSDLKMTQAFSTPTFTGMGIDREYTNSDQHEYYCKCEACNEWQVPEFNHKFVHIEGLPGDMTDLSLIDHELAASLDLLNAYVKCHKCGARLDLANPDLREWVAAYPSRVLKRGYRVRPFSTSRLPISYIVGRLLKAKDQDYLKGWANTVLGESYADSNIRLTEEDILACMGLPSIPEVSSDIPVFVGIDVGNTCHVVLGTHDQRIFLMETVQNRELEDYVKALMGRYNIVGGAIDIQPEMTLSFSIRDITRGKVMPIMYRGTLPVKFEKDEYDNVTHAMCHRTLALDQVAKAVRRRTLSLNGYREQKQAVISHLRDMVRDEQPDKPAVWVKLTGADHWFHSLNYYLLGIRLRGAYDEMFNDEIRTMIAAVNVDVKPVNQSLYGRPSIARPMYSNHMGFR